MDVHHTTNGEGKGSLPNAAEVDRHTGQHRDIDLFDAVAALESVDAVDELGAYLRANAGRAASCPKERTIGSRA